jgi:dephospho-CoA kinase
MIKIGVTGGIGSGKSTVCALFEILGVPVYYADVEAKKLINSDSDLKKQIIGLLGQEAYQQDGTYNRKWVAAKVFENKVLLESLNRLVHPVVKIHTELWQSAIKSQGYPYCLKEAALLYESGSWKNLDYVLYVKAPEALRIKRIMTRDQAEIEQVRQRIKSQWAEEKKEKMADFIIQNDGAHALIPQVWELHKTFIGLKMNK